MPCLREDRETATARVPLTGLPDAATVDNVEAAAHVDLQQGGTLIYYNSAPVDASAVRAIQSD